MEILSLSNVFIIITTIVIAFFIYFLSLSIKSFPHDTFSDMPQKIHTGKISSIGGLIAILSIFFLNFFFNIENINIILYAFCPILIISLMEDFNILINAKIRMILIIISSLLAIILLKLKLDYVNISLIDEIILSNSYISILITIIMISAMVNAFNFIDGLNGLMSSITILILLCFAYTAFNNNYSEIFSIISLLIIVYFVLFFFNFPKSFFFFGDTGAYFAGFSVAIIALLLSNQKDFSPFYQLAVCIYPTTEVIFSFFRKILYENQSPMQPDNKHLHIMLNTLLSKQNFPYSNPLAASIITLFYITYLYFVNVNIENQDNLIFITLIFFIFYTNIYLIIRRRINKY